jgi:serine protease Do
MNEDDVKPIHIPIKTEEDFVDSNRLNETEAFEDMFENGEQQELVNEPDHTADVKAPRPFIRILSLVVIVALVGGLAFGGGVAWYRDLLSKKDTVAAYYLETRVVNEVQKQLSSQSPSPSITEIVKTVGPSVVAITNKMVVNKFFLEQGFSEGSGSGVIFNINKDSVLILTNNHVIENSKELTVAIDADTRYPGELVGVDAVSDLAIIKIDRKAIPNDILLKLQPIIFGNSDMLEVGESAIAIGNPLGYDDTVTVGVISAVNRQVQLESGISTLIQTDAAINPGNSGGALVNGKGELVGINTVKISDTSVEGIGFAIPINSAKPIIEQLLKQGFVSRPYMGISGRNIDEEASNIYELPIGVIVLEVVPNSPASRLGLIKGDVIIEFQSTKITSIEQLVQEIGKYKVGETVSVVYVRDGKDRLEGEVMLQDKNAVLK